MVTMIATWLLKALLVLGVARVIPGIRLGGYGSALAVAAVYGILTALLKWLLVFVTFPAIVFTFGLFILVINGFLLWLTDKILESFEIRSFGALAGATLLLTLGDVLVHAFVHSTF